MDGLVLMCAGAVSGPKGCVVRIQDAIKKPWPDVGPAVVAESAESSESPESTAESTA